MNHPLYEKLRQTAIDGDYTIEQVDGLNFNQAAELLETRKFSNTLLGSIKDKLIAELQEIEEERILQELKQSTRTWLDMRCPGWDSERGKVTGNPFITIWLKGKPETE